MSLGCGGSLFCSFFFFNDTATTEIYTLSLHDALPIWYRLDLVVEGLVVLELKSVSELLPVHSAQLLTYLKLSGRPIGLLINFNVPVLKKGLKRLVNHYAEPVPDATPPSPPSSPRLRVSAVNIQLSPK